MTWPANDVKKRALTVKNSHRVSFAHRNPLTNSQKKTPFFSLMLTDSHVRRSVRRGSDSPWRPEAARARGPGRAAEWTRPGRRAGNTVPADNFFYSRCHHRLRGCGRGRRAGSAHLYRRRAFSTDCGHRHRFRSRTRPQRRGPRPARNDAFNLENRIADAHTTGLNRCARGRLVACRVGNQAGPVVVGNDSKISSRFAGADPTSRG
jgi:hypothetical protein